MPETNFDSSFESTRTLAARFARRELRTRYSGFFTCLGVVFTFGLLFLRDRDLHWLSGFLIGTVFALTVAIVKWYRAAIAAAAIYSGQPIAVHLDGRGVRLVSATLASELPWSSIAAARRVPEGLVLVRRGSAQTIPLPSEALSEEAISFVLSCVKAEKVTTPR